MGELFSGGPRLGTEGFEELNFCLARDMRATWEDDE